jgi:hypothetical protein
MGLRLRIKVLRDAEWIRGRRVPAGLVVVDAPVAPEVDKATLRMALAKIGQRDAILELAVDEVEVEAKPPRKPSKVRVDA